MVIHKTIYVYYNVENNENIILNIKSSLYTYINKKKLFHTNIVVIAFIYLL